MKEAVEVSSPLLVLFFIKRITMIKSLITMYINILNYIIKILKKRDNLDKVKVLVVSFITILAITIIGIQLLSWMVASTLSLIYTNIWIVFIVLLLGFILSLKLRWNDI